MRTGVDLSRIRLDLGQSHGHAGMRDVTAEKVRRDLEHRGRTFQSIRDQYYATVRPMHLEHVEPSKRWADLIVPEGGENTVALDVLLGQLGRIAFGE